MKTNNRIDILEQLLNNGSITELEQDELFELLESEGRLDSWLDSGVKLEIDHNITYPDKEYLKDIAEPMVFLNPDTTQVYVNKAKLYRKGDSQYLTRSVRIAISVAAILLIAFVWKYPTISETYEKETIIAMGELNKTLGAKVNNTKIIEMKKVFQCEVFEPILGDKPYNKVKLSNMNFNHIPKIAHVDINIQVRDIMTPSRYDIVPKPTQDGFIIFAQAEEWTESEPIQQEEVIINHDEWQPNSYKRKGKFRNVLKNIKNHVI